MPQAIFVVPASVTQNIARAKGALRKGDAAKGVAALLEALNLFEPKKVIGKSKYETEVFIMECLEELNHLPRVADFLKKVTKPGKEPKIPYTPGQEPALMGMLSVIQKVLQEDHENQQIEDEGSRDERKAALWRKGNTFLKDGDMPRGKATLRRMVEEFGEDPGVQAMVGEALFLAGLGVDAIDFLEGALRIDPSDNKPYSYLAKAYTDNREFKKAERIYKLALRRFGQHYITLIGFANMYKLWNKRDECYDICLMALKESPGNEEAQALLNWADRK